MHSSEKEIRGSLAQLRLELCKKQLCCKHNLPSTSQAQHTLDSEHRLVRDCITTAYVTGDSTAETQRLAAGRGTAEELLLIGPFFLWLLIAAESEREKERKVCFCISVSGTHRFSIRWQMTRFTPCTLQISLSAALPSSSLPPPSPLPSGYCLIPILLCPPPPPTTHHIHPHIVYFSVSLSSFPASKL